MEFTPETEQMVNMHNRIMELLGETDCTINNGDDPAAIKQKCANAYNNGGYFYPLVRKVLSREGMTNYNNDMFNAEGVDEAASSTERVRKYYKRHPEKVKKYLKDTVKDRSARNRDRAKAVKKHGKSKMKNHDVHHPSGPNGGSWRLAKKDHGRDKVKKESIGETSTPMSKKDILKQTIENPRTKKNICAVTGLSYPPNHPAYMRAIKHLQIYNYK